MNKEEEEIQKPLPGQKAIDHSFAYLADMMLWLYDFTGTRFNVGNVTFYCHIDQMQILTGHEDKNSYTIVIVYHRTPLVKQGK